MSTLVVTGAQWGDEGKGKVVDVVAERASMVVRYAGGNNAGHTLVLDGSAMVTHLVPSGCRYPGTACVLGAGMVIDVDVLQEEVASLRGHGLLAGDELKVSLDAHLVMPYHRALDGLREDAAGGGRIRVGTTRRGIGPAYEAKAARRGIRVRDLLRPEVLAQRLAANLGAVGPELARLGGQAPDADDLRKRCDAWAAWLAPLACDTGDLVHRAVRAGEHVLFEGAQGALLDLDHGTYPFVTSSNTIAGGVCTGVGIGPTLIDGAWGITKAYATRVGNGPFPTRLEGEEGDRLRAAGREFGATTGRPRDCGWLDLPALRHAARLNGYTGLCVTKVDVLASLPRAMVCERYRDGVLPGRDELDRAVPELVELPGWGEPGLGPAVAAAKSLTDLPGAVRAYLDRISEAVEVPVVLVSTGPERGQTLALREPFA